MIPSYKIVNRFEKGQKFLDLVRYDQRTMDDDGRMVEDQCWEVTIYENEKNPNAHRSIQFANEVLAIMFIQQNGWKEQVL